MFALVVREVAQIDSGRSCAASWLETLEAFVGDRHPLQARLRCSSWRSERSVSTAIG